VALKVLLELLDGNFNERLKIQNVDKYDTIRYDSRV